MEFSPRRGDSRARIPASAEHLPRWRPLSFLRRPSRMYVRELGREKHGRVQSSRCGDENLKIQFFEARYLSLLLCDRSFVLSATRVRRLLSSSQAMLFATKKETTIMAAMPARRRGKNE